jgi:hypothetical protein
MREIAPANVNLAHLLAGGAKVRRPETGRWFSVPTAIALVVMPVLILTMASAEHIPGALLAYVNTVIVAAAATYFVRLRTLEALIPLLFLIWQGVAWPVTTIYFACFAPNGRGYVTINEEYRGYLENSVRLQLVTLAFLLSYLPIVWLAVRKRPGEAQVDPDPVSARRLGWIVLLISMFVLVFHATSRFVAMGPGEYVANGLFNYLSGLLFVVGVLFLRLPYATRVLAIALMLLALVFYSIGNARGSALFPFMLFFIGLVFLSELKARWRTWLVVAAVVALPFYLVISNTSRELTGRGGGFENFAYRLQLLGRWREVLDDQSVLFRTMGRLFHTGGHSVVTLTPERYPYLPFNPGAYLYELTTRLFIPGAILDTRFYSATAQLKRYGFRINEKTSVELSFIGSMWLIGGIVPVILGGVALGCFHALCARYLRRVRKTAPCRALFLFGILGLRFLWASNLDLISNVRDTAWSLLIGLVLYEIFVRSFVREQKAVIVHETAANPTPQPAAMSPA